MAQNASQRRQRKKSSVSGGRSSFTCPCPFSGISSPIVAAKRTRSYAAPQTGFAPAPGWLTHTPAWRRLQRLRFFWFCSTPWDCDSRSRGTIRLCNSSVRFLTGDAVPSLTGKIAPEAAGSKTLIGRFVIMFRNVGPENRGESRASGAGPHHPS